MAPPEACPDCAVPCADVGAHRRAAHGRDPAFACAACGFLFWSADKLDAHATQVHAAPRPMCTICHAGFTCKDGLNEHLREAHAPTQMLFCSRCSEPCIGAAGVRAHMDEAHAGDWMTCAACPEGQSVYFAGTEFLAAHRLAVHVDKAHLCGLCGHVSESREANWWHRSKAHPTVYSVRCEECSMRFRTPQNLQLHQKQLHQNGMEGVQEPAPAAKGEEACRYACSGCERTFGTRGSVKRHFAAQHASHACNLCGAIFGTSAWLRFHEAQCMAKLVAGCPFHLPEYVEW
jgi:Zinc finger, C2H2 type